MIWKTTKNTYLIEKDMARVPFLYGGYGFEESAERFEDSAVYYEISASGQIVRKYGAPEAFSLEDEMYNSKIHRVVGDSLYEFFVTQLYIRNLPTTRRAELIMSGLERCENPLPFDADAVIEAYEKA